MWWMSQSDAARAQFNSKDRLELASALIEFSGWMDEVSGVYVWGNGASFDNVILGNAYKAVEISAPWKFWNDRCYRTMTGLYPQVKMNRVGTYHSAIDDAKSQALHLMDIMAYANGPKSEKTWAMP
jgi:exodeoxyribonuclease VIII